MSTALQTKFARLEGELRGELFERTREIRGALVAVVARRHYLMVGPPGVAKSLLVRRLAARIDFGDDQAYFQWLLTKYTTPEEVFGPPSLLHLKETGRYVRNVEGKMPVARFAFLDEYRRANSSILNSLLTIMNERLFFNDGTHVEVPLDVVFAGTNNFEPDDDLHAIDDRFHLRYEVHELAENGNVQAMLMSRLDEHPEKVLTYAEIQQAQAEAAEIPVGADIIETIIGLRDTLKGQGVEPSDRRFAEALPIIRAEAWLNGHEKVETTDLRVLRHVMWSRLQDQKPVEKAVLELVNPLDREAHELLEKIQGLMAEFDKAQRSSDGPQELAKAATEIHAKMARAKAEKDELNQRNIDSGRESELLDVVNQRFQTFAKKLAIEGFGFNSNELAP